MFGRIFGRFLPEYKNNNEATTPAAQPIAQPKVAEEEKKEDVFVFEWGMGFGDVGHAGIQIGGKKPKMTDSDEGEYAGIWPTVPSFGPLTILPLPAGMTHTVAQDAKAQGTKASIESYQVPSNSDEFKSIRPESDEPAMPTHTYKISGLNTSAMREEMKNLRQGTTTGWVRYQLLPEISFISHFINHYHQRSPGCIEDPFSGQTTPALAESESKSNNKPKLQVFNCTSLTEHLLDIGGMEIHKRNRFFRLPWDITPNGLANKVAHDPRATHVPASVYDEYVNKLSSKP